MKLREQTIHTDRFHAWFNSWSEAETEPESEGGDSGLRIEARIVQGEWAGLQAATLSPRSYLHILLICFASYV